MGFSNINISYNPEEPPLLVLALVQLLGVTRSQLTLQASTAVPKGQVDLTSDGTWLRLSEVEAAKQLALLTSTGREVCPDVEGEELLAALVSTLSGRQFAGRTSFSAPLKTPALKQMNAYLSLRTFLVGRRLSLVDLGVYTLLRCSAAEGKKGRLPESWQDAFPHVSRWYDFVHSIENVRAPVERTLKEKVSPGKPATQASYEGKLEGAEEGKVVTRFPPEPSGYLHIGHAKAAMLNHYFAKKYKGKMILRFDDTNPVNETDAFEKSIQRDTALLGVEWERVTYSSDYFEKLQDICTEMIERGVFYVDDTPTEQMRQERGDGIESKRRSDPPSENMQRWREMLAGSAAGQGCCVRAKIDMQCPNKCMRDPVMYRCINQPHHRHGNKFKAYPTYDFACPVIDALEGVTHALRTNEYADRIPQYRWVQEAVGLRSVSIYEFSRMAFVRTVLSKRKLKYFVERGLVDGWDDPRMPTVQGILRRGLTMEALLEFILQQGPSKAGNLMEWDKLWTLNKQIIDPKVPRYMAVSEKEKVLVRISGAPSTVTTQPRRLHAKNESLGEVPLFLFDQILIEGDDARQCEDGEEVTLMHWGNCIFEKVERDASGTVTSIDGRLHLEGDFKKTKKKLNWVALLPDSAEAKLTPLLLREFDHLITVDKIEKEGDDGWEECINKETKFDTMALGDPNMAGLKEGDLLQLERRGYFRVDKTDATRLVLLKIPDGRAKAMSALSSKVEAAKLSGAKIKGGKK